MKRPFWEPLAVLTGLVALGVVTRLSDHTANFTAVAAVGLFSGFYFRSILAVCVPLAVMMISDVGLSAYDPRMKLVVYTCLVLPVLLGRLVRTKASWQEDRRNTSASHLRLAGGVFGSALAGSVVFFLVTNFAAWLGPPHMYRQDWTGLIECFAAAIPFFRNTLCGDLFWSATLFGSYALLVQCSSQTSMTGAVAEE